MVGAVVIASKVLAISVSRILVRIAGRDDSDSDVIIVEETFLSFSFQMRQYYLKLSLSRM